MNTQLQNLGQAQETIKNVMGTLRVQVPSHFWDEIKDFTKKEKRDFFLSKTIEDYAYEGNLSFEIALEHKTHKKAFMKLPLAGYESLFSDPSKTFYLSFDVTPISGKKYPEVELSEVK